MDGNRRMPRVRTSRALGLLAAIAIVATACNSATPSLSTSPSAAAPTEVPSASIVNITPEPIAEGPRKDGCDA